MGTLGERLKRLRQGQTQAWLAKQLGIPPTTLSNYENGKSELNFAIIDTITTNFSVNTDWLLFGRGPMHSDSHAEQTAPLPEAAAHDNVCERCRTLEKRLDTSEAERREVSTDNRQLLKENCLLMQEIGALKLEIQALTHQLEQSNLAKLSCSQH